MDIHPIGDIHDPWPTRVKWSNSDSTSEGKTENRVAGIGKYLVPISSLALSY
jgi:hypothetical protein